MTASSLVDVQVRISAPVDAAWAALTTGIDAWWPTEFYCGGRGDDRKVDPVMHLEAHPGGRMWEDWGDGNGLVWGTVVQCRQGRQLDFAGDLGPAFGGPSRMFGTFQVSDDGDATTVQFTSGGFGRISDNYSAELTKGWQFLLDCMKASIEGTDAPQWS